MKYFASMTTYPARFSSALTAIESINNQTKRPKALVINISEEDWRLAERDFIRQAKFKFKGWVIVEPCINLKPANKIIPTAQKYNDEIIITFDDDVIYPKDRVEKLLEKHREYPENPVAFRTRKVTFDRKKTMPYGSWHLSHVLDGPSKFNFPTSVSGSLYPKNFFPDSFFDAEKYIKLSYDNDDIWTYFHVLLKGSAFVRAGNEIVPPGVPGSQNSALWKSNVSRGGNDKIIERLEKEYGLLYSLTNDNS
jgi:hypothetical protein